MTAGLFAAPSFSGVPAAGTGTGGGVVAGSMTSHLPKGNALGLGGKLSTGQSVDLGLPPCTLWIGNLPPEFDTPGKVKELV
eukprot:SAG22_NODE_12474_length_441_cov_1.342105_1_plen_80_part_01